MAVLHRFYRIDKPGRSARNFGMGVQNDAADKKKDRADLSEYTVDGTNL